MCYFNICTQYTVIKSASLFPFPYQLQCKAHIGTIVVVKSVWAHVNFHSHALGITILPLYSL